MACLFIMVILACGVFIGKAANPPEGVQVAPEEKDIWKDSVKVSIPILEPLLAGDSYDAKTSGYIADLLGLIHKKINTKFTLLKTKDGKYGTLKQDGEWNGAMGELTRGEVDMAGILRVSRMREGSVDFTKPLRASGITVLVKNLPPQPRTMCLMFMPLTAGAWGLLIIACVGVLVVFLLFWQFDPYKGSSNGTATNPLLFVESKTAWRTWGSRVLCLFTVMFLVIVLLFYSAALVDQVSKPDAGSEPEAESVKELWERKTKFYIFKNGSNHMFFKNSQVSLYHQIYKSMEEQNSYVKTSEEGIAKLEQENTALFLDTTVATYYMGKDCDLAQIGGNLNSVGDAFALVKGSRYTSLITQAILLLHEAGELERLNLKWFRQEGKCEEKQEKTDAAKSLGPPQKIDVFMMSGPLILLLIGAIVASLVFMLESFLQRKKKGCYTPNQAEEGLNLSDEVKPEDEKAATPYNGGNPPEADDTKLEADDTKPEADDSVKA